MATLNENLQRLSDARDDIAQAISDKGVIVKEYDGFEDFASEIYSITNSYTVEDEGKVVNNGALVAQTSKTVNSNGTVNTTTNNQVIVNVPFNGGEFRVASVKCRPSITSNGYVIRTINTKAFNGDTDRGFSGDSVWTDGTNIYLSYKYSSSIYYQCVFDKSTSTWTNVNWNISNIDGKYIWTDGDNVYYQNWKSPTSGYVLNKSTSTWSGKSWSGNSDANFNANYIWTDGTNIYYSNGTGAKNYILNKSTSTWETKTWTGMTGFSGNNIWTDGTNIYYSYDTTHKILNKTTSNWTTKTWTGLSSFSGSDVWTDGSAIYYNSSTTEYVLDKTTSTWYSGKSPYSLSGGKIWSDGDHIYFSNGSTHYEIFTSSVQLNNTNGYNIPRMDIVYQ